jgi:glucose-6-phosphate 1-dehydrogenase
MPTTSPPEPCVLVIFGASGDLAWRKLVPALYALDQRGDLAEGFCVVGVARSEMTDEAFRDRMREGAKAHASGFDDDRWARFAQRLHYLAADATKVEAQQEVAARAKELGEARGILRSAGTPNLLFYLSVAPFLYEPIVEAIGGAGIVTEGKRWCSLHPEETAWQRIVVEKPFGEDLESAVSLNRTLGRVFEEEATFRIDHYLGKELVQNILVIRFANTIFEPLWNRTCIDHVQVTAAESIGVGSRAGGYYDTSGALRDMIQSHLLQVVGLVAMEPPTIYDAPAIMQEKIALFNAGKQITPDDAPRVGAFGRYGAGGDTPAYVDLEGVDPERRTETYAAMRVEFDTWRWAGVPFYLRSGKRLAQKLTEVVVQFKEAPTNLFRHMGATDLTGAPNRLVISIAPREGVRLFVRGKVPGPGVTIDTAALDLDYVERFGGEPQEAYGPLLLDAMRGDRTLYKHRDEIEGAWRLCQPLLDSEALRASIETYEPGTWGPASADELLARDGRAWHAPES